MINHYNIDRYILESLFSGLSSGGGAAYAPPPGGNVGGGKNDGWAETGLCQRTLMLKRRLMVKH